MKMLWLAVAGLLVTASAWGFDAASGCVNCHGNRKQMKELGAEAMYLDPAQVDREVGMQGKPTCTDCHLGNPAAADKTAAHTGMLAPFLVAAGKNHKGQAVSREAAGALQPLVPKGNGMASMIPKGDPKKLDAAGIKRIIGIQWHDRDPETMAYAPKVAQQTCGKCHAKQVTDYNSSAKGLTKNQRAFRDWSDKQPGPQNCGMWPGQNEEGIRNRTSIPYTKAMNGAMERSCNMCHASCNDCHFKPVANKGTHSFGKPDTPSCYGSGRASICHAGPMDRRRGAGYVRGEYAFPSTLPKGAHVTAGLECLDCHKPANHQFGHLAADDARKSCANCHGQIVKAVQGSPHGTVDCASCHVTVSGAYQYTFWGQGHYYGVETPYGKHKEYYGTRDLPTIIKNAAGRYIPVKPYPMAVLNQTRELGPTGLLFRAIPQKTVPGNPRIGEPLTFEVARAATDVNDAYIVVGTRNDLPGGNKAILWIQMDKLSHAMGTPRSCGSCHDSKAQVGKSEWSFFEDRDVTKPFKGSYTVTADKNGIRFSDVVWEQPSLAPNRKLQDVAPFAVLPTTAWDVKGIDFTLPYSKKKTDAARRDLDRFLAELDKRPKDSRTAEIRAVAYHNLAMARKMLKTGN
ncbi:cytochrome C [Trichlorobacter ammonificans]|uniref:Cytochrome c family protein n=1 Tax=Trichlorobacter ammonificans TaxID=2916410 RepID=A0ABN8HLU2_9BACT|nr:cytochrome C [Trichlorobacter ammonificans]CAH2032005.1 Cytochrome c family protein [Trichlorobacter ammonificans]